MRGGDWPNLQLMGWPLLVFTGARRLLFLVSGVDSGDPAWAWWSGSSAIRRGQVPGRPGLVVSPADGKVAEITRLAHDEFIGGPAVRIGIFLSIFNVHLNRVAGRLPGDGVAVLAAASSSTP